MIIHDIEQRSEAWHQLRAGMPTASMFSKMVTSKGELSKSLTGYAQTLAGAVYAGKEIDPWDGNAWTERGTELEETARKLYEFKNEVAVEEVGFITDDKSLWGCSPDGLVNDDGMVEFKCLKAENHIKAIMDYAKSGKCPTTYIQQVQGQMLISDRIWCDLVFYHPELPLLVIRQDPDFNVVDGLKKALPKILLVRDEIVATLKACK